jgi:hypothetical protein
MESIMSRSASVAAVLAVAFSGFSLWGASFGRAGETPPPAGAPQAGKPETEGLTLEERLARLEKALEESRKNQSSGGLFFSKPGFEAKLYGYFKFDAAYDDARVNTGNYAAWVESQAVHEKDDEFNATANQTRLGLTITGTTPGEMKPSGTLEVDLYGNGTAENKPGLLVRHAYAQLDFPGPDLSIIAGQTSDLVSPLNPSTLNYTVMWWNGNIGYRRPQLRITEKLKFDSVGVELAAAGTRNIGHDNGAFDPGDTGEDSGLPGAQWRAALSLPLLTDKPTVLGVSGHWAREEWDRDASDTFYYRTSSSVNLDLTLPLVGWLAVKGEAFQGKNLDSLLGGIGQGINATTGEEIHSKGFWAAASIRPTIQALSAWELNIGAGVDDPDNEDLAVGSRSRNLSEFVNLSYDFGKGVSVGAEFMHMETDYLGEDDPAKANRVQLSLIYKF